jgi:very-short-patch-repair endonuclease
VCGGNSLCNKNKILVPRRNPHPSTVLSPTEEDGMNNNPTTLQARDLRQTANPAEMCLWNALKGRQLGGYKFTRQYPVGPYFADFACRQQFLLVEVDGSQHCGNTYDDRRDQYLLDEGYSILRFPSLSVLQHRDIVCDTILAALEGRIENFVEADDLRFLRSFSVPRRFTRHRPWLPPTPASPV